MLYLGATLIGVNFGVNFALFPVLTADEFGNDLVGQNYPWVFLSYGAGGIVFPILGGWLGDLGNFPLAFSIVGTACIVGAAAVAVVFPQTMRRRRSRSRSAASCTTLTCSITSATSGRPADRCCGASPRD